MKLIKGLLSTALVACVALSATAKTEYYVKTVTFPEGASLDKKIEMVSHLRPTAQQYAWQKMELTAFLHFTVNTFTNKEWGDGTEPESVFNPTNFDAEQWVTTLKNAGFKMAILTAKHHDGFCLWQTATTKHSVASSPWKDGKGDVVRELSEACRKHGMKLGIYISPWDRNASCYGTDAYNDYYVAQITELLTNYGQVDEVWFDGACGEGPNGKKQVYDMERFQRVINELQPNAVTAIMGNDIRWVGNESGLGRETEWSTTALYPEGSVKASTDTNMSDLNAMAKDLGSRKIVERANKMFWYPSEVDVSIRNGWFWHASEKPKTLAQLVDIYLQSVGRNSVLLLNIPPNREGRLDDADCAVLAQFGEYLKHNFANNKLKKAKNITLRQGQSTTIKAKGNINCVVLQEDILKGQRVENFIVRATVDGKQVTVAQGTTIGYKRIVTFPTVNATAVTVSVTRSRAEAHLANIEAYELETPAE